MPSYKVDNSNHFSKEGAEPGKLMCNFCGNCYSSKTLNVNVMAGHLSDRECAKRYQIKLCSSVPQEISMKNVKYITSIKSKAVTKHHVVNILQAEAESEINEIQQEMKAQVSLTFKRLLIL